VNGAFGGSPPAPSGDGVLAYVEFLKVGRGPSDVTLDNPVVTEIPPEVSVPEPGTLALLATGVLLARSRRFRRTSPMKCFS